MGAGSSLRPSGASNSLAPALGGCFGWMCTIVLGRGGKILGLEPVKLVIRNAVLSCFGHVKCRYDVD